LTFSERKIHDLWNLFSALLRKKKIMKNYSQHFKINSKGSWIFLSETPHFPKIKINIIKTFGIYL